MKRNRGVKNALNVGSYRCQATIAINKKSAVLTSLINDVLNNNTNGVLTESSNGIKFGLINQQTVQSDFK